MLQIIQLSDEDLANLDVEGGGVTAKTKNLKMKRFQAFHNYINECELEKADNQGKLIVTCL